MSVSSAWFPATLVRARALTATARSLTFAADGWPGNAAGQHVDVRLSAPDGYQAVRSYSIASAGDGAEIELAVDRLPDGEVSPFLVDDIEVGDTVELRGPLGGWFVWTPEDERPVQLIGGGSGVVPFVAMARMHALTASAAPMQLLYSLRSPADAFYAEELSSLGGLETAWHYTRAAPSGWTRPAARITADDLQRETLAPDLAPSIFICGPTGFVETVSRAMLELGHAERLIRTERFGGT
ncbi:FAD-binding oxidoreductase [Microbacterium sp. SA39]|uniref:FAD-binding oxidoreductase n=1 Tax=Microbacterium sp. SA39 TaxID=1263625 RepID=UPI00061E9742|nr:FAD-binding oxidoreductase [Microbacterium sp. SA39]KJQ54307.1 Flavohemoprotein [Microbacterium sp. SA39]